jgi:PAS domain S-box-containing protein
MSDAFGEADRLASLRRRAAEKLSGGDPAPHELVSQTEALAVLYKLASSPTTAVEAVAVLHELQVHQVEVDLQQEELRRSQSELEAALRRQAELVERAPVGYMTIDAGSLLYEINLAGMRLLGGRREDLLGRPLNEFLTTPSIDALRMLFDRLRDGRGPETCELQLRQIGAVNRTVQAVADQDSTLGHYLLVLMSPAAVGS